MDNTKVHYRTIDSNGINIFYREAGGPDAPVILLLHGYPTSSHMFRNLTPILSMRYHVIAPDLPGFGYSDAPDRESFSYTFDNLTKTIQEFINVLDLQRFAMYVFDYGAPVGFRLPAGAEGFKKDNPSARVTFYDTGHFALETHASEIGNDTLAFLGTLKW